MSQDPDGTAGGDPGERTCLGAPAGGLSGLSEVLLGNTHSPGGHVIPSYFLDFNIKFNKTNAFTITCFITKFIKLLL